MTGFARTAGEAGPFGWAWELRSVNAKGLDLRLRLPPGLDALESDIRARVGRVVSRGTCTATLSTERRAAGPEVRVNEAALDAVASALKAVAQRHGLAAPSLDGLLSVRGILEVSDGDTRAETGDASAAVLAGFDQALADLVSMRSREGGALRTVLAERLAAILRLVAAAESAPERRPDAVRARFLQTIADLTGAVPTLDPDRLSQELVLLAAKADIREELDRLRAHEAAARELLTSDAPVGRRLDFLAQELAREANTLCAKSNHATVTAIGLDLKVEIEQFREQVQNIE